MITGHQGVGKTTIAQQLVLHRVGMRADGFLRIPVAKCRPARCCIWRWTGPDRLRDRSGA